MHWLYSITIHWAHPTNPASMCFQNYCKYRFLSLKLHVNALWKHLIYIRFIKKKNFHVVHFWFSLYLNVINFSMKRRNMKWYVIAEGEGMFKDNRIRIIVFFFPIYITLTNITSILFAKHLNFCSSLSQEMSVFKFLTFPGFLDLHKNHIYIYGIYIYPV